MSLFRTNQDYSKGLLPTNASWVGDWLWVENADSVAFIATMLGTGSPTATLGVDLSNDPDANKKNDPLHGTANDAQLLQPPTAMTLSAAQIAQNPAGTTAAINALWQFDPSPRAKWARVNYTRASGGSATPLLRISVSLRGK